MRFVTAGLGFPHRQNHFSLVTKCRCVVFHWNRLIVLLGMFIFFSVATPLHVSSGCECLWSKEGDVEISSALVFHQLLGSDLKQHLNVLQDRRAMAGPRPVVFSGPSGAGKSTLLKKLMKEYDSVFGFSVSHTTRNPRPGEENGKDYHYVTREQMQAGIDNGEFIENAEFSGNMYGTSRAAVQDVQAKNLICILDIDMQGVRNIKRTDLNPIYISIQPPSIQVLETRLRARKTESEESLRKRLQAAKVEIEFSKEPGAFDFTIINDNLDEAYGELRDVLHEEINKVKTNASS